jgi:hypothetical protein
MSSEASAEWRVKWALAIATSGPGVSNLVTGLATACPLFEKDDALTWRWKFRCLGGRVGSERHAVEPD